MTQQYGQYKRTAMEATKLSVRRPTPTPLTAQELAKARQAQADWHAHFGNDPLIKELHAAGLIDGWRDVTVTVNEDE